MKVSLGLPSNRGFQPKTFNSLLEMIAHNKDINWHILCASEGYTIAENRNWIAAQAVKNNLDYLLMCDDDMVFPPDLLDRLLANNKNICGVAYHPRCETGQIIKYLDETHFIRLKDNIDPKYKQTFECYATGTGIILIKCEVFRKTPQPWFMFDYYDNGCVKEGEDWFFCKKIRKFGFKIWSDPRISVGHIGEKIF